MTNAEMGKILTWKIYCIFIYLYHETIIQGGKTCKKIFLSKSIECGMPLK